MDNMSRAERRGFFKLLNRVRKKEIVITTTDKSGELAILTMEAYLEMGKTHVRNVKVASWEEVRDAKHVTLCHIRALSKVFQTGEAHGETSMERTRGALHEDRTILPNLVLSVKNQKPVDPTTKLPKTRPVCQASKTFNMRASGHLCQVLKATIATDNQPGLSRH